MLGNTIGARIRLKRAQWGLLLLGCMSMAVAADKAAELSDEFLEYLGSLEGDAESWMDFTADAMAQRKAATQASAASSSAASAASASSKRSSDSSAALKTDAGKADK